MLLLQLPVLSDIAHLINGAISSKEILVLYAVLLGLLLKLQYFTVLQFKHRACGVPAVTSLLTRPDNCRSVNRKLFFQFYVLST